MPFSPVVVYRAGAERTANSLAELSQLIFDGWATRPGSAYFPPADPRDLQDSAYDDAVELGFVGTLADWLASLVGPQGPPGPPGNGEASLLPEHIASLTPHPAYDDLPELTLLFENGMA